MTLNNNSSEQKENTGGLIDSIVNRSLEGLRMKLKVHLQDHQHKLNDEERQKIDEDLTLINQCAGYQGLPLYLQSPKCLAFLFGNLIKHTEVMDIFTALCTMWADETKNTQIATSKNGRFTIFSLHDDRRERNTQLTDQDMERFMPKSTGEIEVLTCCHRFDPQSRKVIIDALAEALKNANKKHIVIPIGPGHWRGFYLTKPNSLDQAGKYSLEIFDPYGPDNIKSTDTDNIMELLTTLDVPSENIDLMLTGPTIIQKDSYACGDFTCAYSHLKMRALGALSENYNQELIDALQKGNPHENPVLRNTLVRLSKTHSEHSQPHLVHDTSMSPAAAVEETSDEDIDPIFSGLQAIRKLANTFDLKNSPPGALENAVVIVKQIRQILDGAPIPNISDTNLHVGTTTPSVNHKHVDDFKLGDGLQVNSKSKLPIGSQGPTENKLSENSTDSDHAIIKSKAGIGVGLGLIGILGGTASALVLAKVIPVAAAIGTSLATALASAGLVLAAFLIIAGIIALVKQFTPESNLTHSKFTSP